MDDLFAKVMEVCQNLFSMQALTETLKQPGYTVAAFIALTLVIFVETGLLFPFLPGDSLLVVVGVVAYECGWSLPLLFLTLSLAAIIGDSVAYSIGYKTGPRIFSREQSLLFRKDHLLKAQEFYERHGGKTIVLARFVPIVRTFAPVVAGVGRMRYRDFLYYNVIGGIGWVCSMLVVGYFLTRAIDPAFQALLGRPEFSVREHIEKVIIIVVLLSIAPGIWAWARGRLAPKPAAAEQPAAAEKEPVTADTTP
jgi:membrane-associated protein